MMPRPRSSDMTKAVANQVVMLSGTVTGISADVESLHNHNNNNSAL